MLQPLLGFIVLLLPFTAIVCFEDRLRGFFKIFVLIGALHLFVAILSQLFHVFYYPVILGIHAIVGVTCLYFASRNYTKAHVREKKRNLFVPFCFAIIVLFLYSIHFCYNGVVDTGFRAQGVTESSYSYPFYSDEWAAVAFANWSIANNALPLANPLNLDSTFINFLAGFHSLIAEVLLLLSLSPLTYYVWLAIANGFLICLFAYFVLRLSKVSTYASAAAAVGIVFITSSGNLPGIINLLPYDLSLTFFLAGIIGALLQSEIILSFGFAVALILYPPMVMFILPTLIGIFLKTPSHFRNKFFRKTNPNFALCLIAPLVVFFIGLARFGYNELFDRIFSFLLRNNLEHGTIIFEPWNIIPIFILPFSLVGLWIVYKRRVDYLYFPIIIGAALWIIYGFEQYVLIIDHSRVVAITALFVVMVGAFGMDSVFTYILDRHPDLADPIMENSLKCIVLVFFVFWSMFYSRFGLWDKLVLVVNDSHGTAAYIPSPPVTRYLSEGDVKLFAPYKGKIFISEPWKGLVVGVATGNYPLDSKASTITNNILNYFDFMNADCKKKEMMAEKFKIDLAYTAHFSCPTFKEIGESGEGVALYKHISK